MASSSLQELPSFLFRGVPAEVEQLVGTPETRDALVMACAERAHSAQLYRKRRAAVDALAEQTKAGLWHAEEVSDAVWRARRDHALLWKLREDWIALHEDRHDLDLGYAWPSAAALALEEGTFQRALGFLERAPGPDTSQGLGLAGLPWAGALALEARSYLLRLCGDWHLVRALAFLEKVLLQARAVAAARDLFDPVAIWARIGCVVLYYEVGLPSQVRTEFDAFRAAYASHGDPRFPWLDRLQGDAAFDKATRRAFVTLLRDVIAVEELRNPADRSEIAFLKEMHGVYKALLVSLPMPPPPLPVALPAVELAQAAADLACVGRALGPSTAEGRQPASRVARVLGAWQAVAHSNLKQFRPALQALGSAETDGEALGIVSHALTGEARYWLADYEDAHLSLSRAGELAKGILARVAGAAEPSSDAGVQSARGFLARLAQLDGNALFLTGEATLAGEAYEQAGKQAGNDPLAQAIHQVNLGNLALLRENLVDARGYTTIDTGELYKVAEQGAPALRALRNAAALPEAEGHYRAALECLASGPGYASGPRRSLAATLYVNLGNVAWGWARVLDALDRSDVGDLASGPDATSSLVTPASSRADCFRAAAAQQLLALDLAQDEPSTAATAWCNLTELHYLLWEQTGQAAELGQGHFAARQCRRLIGDPLSGVERDRLARRGTWQPELAWRLAHNRARLHEAQGHAQAAGRGYRRAIRILESMRGMIRLEAWQATFLQDKLEVYEDAIWHLFRRDPRRNAGRILALVEQTKARAFLDLLESARLKVGLDPALVREQQELLASIAAGNDELRRAVAEALPNDPAARQRVGALNERQAQLLADWRELESRVAADQQRDGDLIPPQVPLGALQRSLPEGTLLLSFFLGRRSSFLLAIDRLRARVFRLAGRREVELAVTRLQWYCQYTGTDSFAQFRAADEEVTQLLLGPLAEEGDGLAAALAGKQVIIIPDGVLWYLPFEALLLADAGAPGLEGIPAYQALRPAYWLSQPGAILSYAPSASAWLSLAQRRPAPPAASLLAVYDVNYRMGLIKPPFWALNIVKTLDDLPALHAVGQVVEQFAGRWPARLPVALRARRSGGEAEAPELQSIEDNFIRVATGSPPQVILFAGHATYNDKFPNLSGLIFNLSPVKDGALPAPGSVGRQDGFLRLEELFQLDLPATELTFLAACQTGLGWMYRGEGLGALTRAFLYRGCPAVIASLWAVNDQSTRLLVESYFELFLAQPEADRAALLAQAKRQVMGDPRYSLPFYWSPFVFTGVSTVPGSTRPRRRSP